MLPRSVSQMMCAITNRIRRPSPNTLSNAGEKMIPIKVDTEGLERVEVITRRPALKKGMVKSTTCSRSRVMLMPAMPTSAWPFCTAASNSSTDSTFTHSYCT